jgi:hypothetical protein
MITARGDKWMFQHACSRKVVSPAPDSEGVEPEEQAGNKFLFLLSFRDSKNNTELFTTIVQGSDYLTNTSTYDEDGGLEADADGQEPMHGEEDYVDPVIRLPEKFRKWLKDTITSNHLDGTYCTMHAFRTDTNQSCNLVWGETSFCRLITSPYEEKRHIEFRGHWLHFAEDNKIQIQLQINLHEEDHLEAELKIVFRFDDGMSNICSDIPFCDLLPQLLASDHIWEG